MEDEEPRQDSYHQSQLAGNPTTKKREFWVKGFLNGIWNEIAILVDYACTCTCMYVHTLGQYYNPPANDKVFLVNLLANRSTHWPIG